MQPPPPAGFTGNAPPGAGAGGAGATLLDGAVEATAVVSPAAQPPAEASATTHNAAAVLAVRFVTTDNCSSSTPNALGTRPDSPDGTKKLPRIL